MSVFRAVLWKDLAVEWRSRDRVVAMLLFSLLVVMIFQFSLPGGAGKGFLKVASFVVLMCGLYIALGWKVTDTRGGWDTGSKAVASVSAERARSHVANAR